MELRSKDYKIDNADIGTNIVWFCFGYIVSIGSTTIDILTQTQTEASDGINGQKRHSASHTIMQLVHYIGHIHICKYYFDWIHYKSDHYRTSKSARNNTWIYEMIIMLDDILLKDTWIYRFKKKKWVTLYRNHLLLYRNSGNNHIWEYHGLLAYWTIPPLS